MGKATGYTCDRQGCGRFEASEDNKPPKGWVTIRPSAVHPTTVDSPLSTQEFIYCGDYCLAVAAVERYEAREEKKFSRPYSKPHPGRRGHQSPEVPMTDSTRSGEIG